jgi:hypothetical protein
MRVLKLPDLPEFSNFETEGPNGRHQADINGRGAAIECYLDFDRVPLVRWNNYNSAVATYQGELVAKDSYKRRFLDQREKVAGYNYRKIEAVLDMITKNCIAIAEKALGKSLD